MHHGIITDYVDGYHNGVHAYLEYDPSAGDGLHVTLVDDLPALVGHDFSHENLSAATRAAELSPMSRLRSTSFLNDEALAAHEQTDALVTVPEIIYLALHTNGILESARSIAYVFVDNGPDHEDYLPYINEAGCLHLITAQLNADVLAPIDEPAPITTSPTNMVNTTHERGMTMATLAPSQRDRNYRYV